MTIFSNAVYFRIIVVLEYILPPFLFGEGSEGHDCPESFLFDE